MGDQQAAGGDEAAARERGQPDLVGAALGVEAAGHRAERALGDRVIGALGEGEQQPQAVVAAAVVERHRHPHEILAGVQFDHGQHRDLDLADAVVIGDLERPTEGAGDLDASPDGAGLVHQDVDVDRATHHLVTRRR